MALRVTQQNVEVLSEATGGKVRVTQFYIEVIGEVGAAPVISDALSLSQSATETLVPGGIPASGSNSMSLSDSATQVRARPGSATHSLGVTDAATNVVDRQVSGSNSLAFSQSATETDFPVQPAANALALTDSVTTFGDKRASAADTLSLGDSATLPSINVEASSDLSVLSDSAVQTGLTQVSAADSLAFTQSLTNGIIFVSVSQAMSLVQTPYAGQNITASASSAVAFTQDEAPGIDFAAASDALAFAQIVLGDLQGAPTRFVNDPLALTDAASGVIHDFVRSLGLDPPDLLHLTHTVKVGRPWYVSASDILSLASIPDQRQGIANVSVSHFLDLQDITGRVQFRTASDTLTLTQAAFRRFFATSILSLTDAVLVKLVKPLNDDLGLTDLATRVFVANRSFSHNLGLASSVAVFISHNGVLCQYAPFIGDGPGTAIPATMPTLGTAKVTLTYPFVSPTSTLVLRNPQFGNVDRLAFDRINRETRGGTLIMFVDPKWPKQQVMNVTFAALTRAMKDSLLTFLAASIGKDIGYLDHENRQWKGIVLTPEATIQNDSRNGYTVTFEFEGTLQ